MALDTYAFRARLLPASVVVLPITVGIIAFFPPDSLPTGLITGLLSGLGITALLSQVARDPGRRKQSTLWASWGGAPTNRMLGHRTSTLNSQTLQRYHRRLAKAVGVRLPDAFEEEADPDAATAIYTSCSDFLREFTRDKEQFSLVFEENVNYGFRRNLWGMRAVGITVAILGIVFCLIAGCSEWMQTSTVPPVALIGAVINVVLLVLWCLRITPKWVRDAADAYAQQLIAACERLPEPDPATPTPAASTL